MKYVLAIFVSLVMLYEWGMMGVNFEKMKLGAVVKTLQLVSLVMFFSIVF